MENYLVEAVIDGEVKQFVRYRFDSAMEKAAELIEQDSSRTLIVSVGIVTKNTYILLHRLSAK